MSEEILASTIAAAVVVCAVALLLLLRRRASQRGEEALRVAAASGQNLPPSLHPVIDPTLCIGSFSCIKACPEGDIIGVVDGVAHLVEAAHCIGHSRCATDCPVGAIKLVFGSAERGMDIPETDEDFESSKKGIFIVGELAGMGLIKNALRQGVDVGRTLKKRLKESQVQGDMVDVVVVGGGPAGLAAAASLKEQGLVARVLEQESLGGCIAHYPRGKVVMSEAVMLPYYGKFGRSLLSKEDLMQELSALIRKAEIKVEEGHRVLEIVGEEPMFSVKTSKDMVVRARAVVLAIGMRGSPRRLNVAGEVLEKVTYRLADPEQYHGMRVLVVGGGDSAVEAAIQLAEESTAKVSISYRQENFSRCKQRNREKVQELIDANRVRFLASTEVKEIREHVVMLSTKEGEIGTLKNDHVIVSAGGDMPTAFLKSAGVNIRRYKGEEKGTDANSPARGPTKAQVEARTRRRLAIALLGVGSTLLISLFLIGQEYYWLTPAQRELSPLHQALRPAGLWGHGVGVIATVFMMANFLYALRKRWRPLKGAASIRTWLTFHMFVGVMSPLVIGFHAAFLFNNLLAVWTWIALSVVVGTGIFGRVLFGLVPAQAGKLQSLADIREELQRISKLVAPQLAHANHGAAVEALFKDADRSPARTSFFRALLTERKHRADLRQRLTHARPLFADGTVFTGFESNLLALSRARTQVAFYASFKRLFRSWLVFHVVLSLFMVVLIAAHIAVTIYLGYGWIFVGNNP